MTTDERHSLLVLHYHCRIASYNDDPSSKENVLRMVTIEKLANLQGWKSEYTLHEIDIQRTNIYSA